MKEREIPNDLSDCKNIVEELDYFCGSVELCNMVLLPILKKHGIDPESGWIRFEMLDKETALEIYKAIFN